jgi:hypothetical protein
MPKPDVGKWNITDKNITCILAEMAIQLNITYTTTENKVRKQCLRQLMMCSIVFIHCKVILLHCRVKKACILKLQVSCSIQTVCGFNCNVKYEFFIHWYGMFVIYQCLVCIRHVSLLLKVKKDIICLGNIRKTVKFIVSQVLISVWEY